MIVTFIDHNHFIFVLTFSSRTWRNTGHGNFEACKLQMTQNYQIASTYKEDFIFELRIHQLLVTYIFIPYEILVAYFSTHIYTVGHPLNKNNFATCH